MSIERIQPTQTAAPLETEQTPASLDSEILKIELAETSRMVADLTARFDRSAGLDAELRGRRDHARARLDELFDQLLPAETESKAA